MPEYKETTINGSSYQRGRTLIFENPLNSTPSVLIVEERATRLDDRVILERIGEIRKSVSDLSITFQLRNPLTNELIGATSTYQDLYVLLFSLYWHLAELRDAEAQTESPQD